MADRFCAQIEIGGRISRSKMAKECDGEPDDTVLRLLMDTINHEGVSNEYGNAPAFVSTETELLEHRDEEEMYLRFRDDQACNGEMNDLETFLRLEGIPYRRWSSMYSGYMGEDVTFDGETLHTVLCDDNGNEHVAGEPVREAIGLLGQYFDPDNSAGTGDPSIRGKAMAILKKLCPPLPEALPKFEIVE